MLAATAFLPYDQLKMMLFRLTSLTLLGLISAAAQNSDLGVLFTATVTRYNFGSRTETQYRIGALGNYAWQITEGAKGRWYLEVPVSAQGGPIGQGVFTDAGAVRILARPQGVVFVTPGVRYHYGLTDRVAVYAAVGSGVAFRQQQVLTLRLEPGPNQLIRQDIDWRTNSAFNVGAGLDFRLSPLLSLRGELRRFRTSAQTGYGDGRTYPALHIGLAFHF